MEENAAAQVRVKPEPREFAEEASRKFGPRTGNLGASQAPPPREHREPMQIPSNSVPPGDSNKAASETEGKVVEDDSDQEDPIDTESIKGIFGWETVDDTSIPYILRKNKKFVSVRIVERKLLSKYPNTFPDELGKKDPLVSYFITEAEANLLNEINTAHCDYEYGHNPFTVKDLIVDLDEFEEFFKIVKKTFPADVLAKIGGETAPPVPPVPPVMSPPVKPDLSNYCGWIQINNTVSPYILRLEAGKQVKLVPLSVIVYAAGLLTNTSVDGLLPTPHECAMLNEACKVAGFEFTFGKNTRLISITEVIQRCQVQLFELPFINPLQHARYLDPRTGQPSSSPLVGYMPPAHSTAAMVQHQPAPAPRQSQANMEMMSGKSRDINPFMATFQRPGFSVPQINVPGGLPGYRDPTSTAMMRLPGLPAGMGMDPNHVAGLGAQVMADKNIDNHGPSQQGMLSSFWPMMPRVPPPAHVNNASNSIMSKTPPVTPDPPVSSAYQPSLPPNSVLHSKPSVMPDLNHPIYRGTLPHRPPVNQSMQKDHTGLVRYPPPVTGLPPPPPQYSNSPAYPFGVNQFDSSLFARTDRQDQQPFGDSRAVPGQSSSRRSSFDSSKNLAHAPNSVIQSASTSRPPTNPQRHIISSSRPPTSSNNNHSKPEFSHEISACLVNGKSISCINVDLPHRKGSFCLVEAVSKLYFPTVPLVEFVKVLQMVLKVSLHECTPQEEAAFVQYYNLPVNKLKCNKIIKVEDLEKYFPQLNYMFTKCSSQPVPGQPGQNLNPPALPVSQKRRLSSPTMGPPAKMVQPKLENVVRKLHHERDATQNGGTSSRGMNSDGSVIVIDDE